MATASQWSFYLISINTQNWTGLWIPSPNLLLLHQINWFSASNLTDLQKRKKKIMREVVARRCSAKTLSWKFDKIYIEISVLEYLSEEAVVQWCSIKRKSFSYVLFYKNLILVNHIDNNFLFYFDICIKFTLSAIISTMKKW